MKDIMDMTHDEVGKLTAEELENQVQLKMAQNGVKFISRPKEPEYPELPKKDLRLFTAGLFHFWVSADDVMREFEALVHKHQDKIYSVERSYGLDQPFAQLAVELKDSYSDPFLRRDDEVYLQSNKHKVKDGLKQHASLKKEYEADLDAYKKNEKEKVACSRDVYDLYDQVQHIDRMRNKYLKQLGTYLELAEGNREIAWTFFEKAYSKEEEYDEDMQAFLRQKFFV
jgi:hypothetical protein